MLPVTLLCENKLAALFSGSNGLSLALSDLATQNAVTVPALTTANIVTSSATASVCDQNLQLSYPRVTISSHGFKNTLRDKFCSLSGSVDVTSEIYSSGDLISSVETSTHYYVAAVTALLAENVGDWGDGVFFPGLYDVRFDPITPGGFGFLQTARIGLSFHVSRA